MHIRNRNIPHQKIEHFHSCQLSSVRQNIHTHPRPTRRTRQHHPHRCLDRGPCLLHVHRLQLTHHTPPPPARPDRPAPTYPRPAPLPETRRPSKTPHTPPTLQPSTPHPTSPTPTTPPTHSHPLPPQTPHNPVPATTATFSTPEPHHHSPIQDRPRATYSASCQCSFHDRCGSFLLVGVLTEPTPYPATIPFIKLARHSLLTRIDPMRSPVLVHPLDGGGFQRRDLIHR